MALKKPAAASGAPEWVVTYGDMMSLLLCFFVLLAAMANFDDQDKLMMSAIESIREALGSPGQRGWMADRTIDFKSMLIELASMAPPDRPKNMGESDEAGSAGRYYRVSKIRDGLEVVMGGPIAFERFSADLQPEGRRIIGEIAHRIRGYRNKIEIRGHTTNEPLPPDSPFTDQMSLSFARAKSVRDWLIATGVAPRRIRILAAGPYEPRTMHAYTEAQRSENRRVEIVIYQSTVDDYERPPTQPVAGDAPPGGRAR